MVRNGRDRPFAGTFASKHMEKLGWEQGKGLGKTTEGMQSYVRVKRKDDNKGIGMDKVDGELENNWWFGVFNKTAAKAKRRRDKAETGASSSDTSSSEVVPQALALAPKNDLYLGMFVKAAPKSQDSSKGSSSGDAVVQTDYTADELYKACGGRRLSKAVQVGGARGKEGRIRKTTGQSPSRMVSVSGSDSSSEDSLIRQRRERRLRAEKEAREKMKTKTKKKKKGKKKKKSKRKSKAKLNKFDEVAVEGDAVSESEMSGGKRKAKKKIKTKSKKKGKTSRRSESKEDHDEPDVHQKKPTKKKTKKGKKRKREGSSSASEVPAAKKTK